MIRAAVAEARVFESWQDYQEALKRAIAPLTEEQLGRRLLPGLRTPGEIATHIVFGRAKWVHHVLGERAAELLPLLVWHAGTSLARRKPDVLCDSPCRGPHVSVSCIPRFIPLQCNPLYPTQHRKKVAHTTPIVPGG